jgi:hypothetical protein
MNAEPHTNLAGGGLTKLAETLAPILIEKLRHELLETRSGDRPG